MAASGKNADVAVAIVGGGIGGLACALAFQRLGHEVHVIEQQPALGEVGAGLGLWRGAVKTLSQLELAPWFWALRTFPFRWAETASPDGRRRVGFDVSQMTADAPGFFLRRADLHRALAEQLSPGTVTLAARAIGVRQHGTHAEIHLADGARVRARLVVGADGVQSVVRETLHGRRAPRYHGETCYRGMARFRGSDPDVLREVQAPGRRCAVHAIDAEHVYWWAARHAPAGLEESAQQRHDALAIAFAGWRFGFPEALAATPAAAILKNDLFDRPPLRRWSSGRVTLLGDAAHPTTPNLGLGGCMAIEDALVLARAYTEQRGSHGAVLAQYERERRRRTASAVRAAAAFGRMGSVQQPALVKGRDLLVRATPTALSAAVFRRQVAYEPGPLRR